MCRRSPAVTDVFHCALASRTSVASHICSLRVLSCSKWKSHYVWLEAESQVTFFSWEKGVFCGEDTGSVKGRWWLWGTHGVSHSPESAAMCRDLETTATGWSQRRYSVALSLTSTSKQKSWFYGDNGHHNSLPGEETVYTWVFQVKKQSIGFQDKVSRCGIQSYNFFCLNEFN